MHICLKKGCLSAKLKVDNQEQRSTQTTQDNNMAQSTQSQAEELSGIINFSTIATTRVQASFDEPDLVSDGGVLLVREAAERNGIIDRMVSSMTDKRSPAHVKHTYGELLSQRVVQICHGYEDANDCDYLKDDPAIKVAVGRRPDSPDSLCSQPTMSRLENSVGIRDLIRLFYGFVDHFLESYEREPEMICIDMDPTENRVYGAQQLSLFNAHYDDYCLMPFHIYEGLTGRLIAAIVRPGKTPTKEEILALLKRIVARIRNRFPNTMIVFRADSHHTKPEVMDWLESNDVRYVLGIGTNSRLKEATKVTERSTARIYEQRQSKVRQFHSFQYAAGTWKRDRRIVARVEATAKGVDTRYIVTDFECTGAKYLYETIYCGRARAELMIKEHKCYLKSSRTSCHTATANQFRLFLHSAAYLILHGFRDTVLKGTRFATSSFESIRLHILKVAARIEVGKTFVRFHMPEKFDASDIYFRTAEISSALTKT